MVLLALPASSSNDELLVVCLKAGHLTKKNKKCSMYSEEEPEIVAPWLPDLHMPDPLMQVSTPHLSPPPPLPQLLGCHTIQRMCVWAASEYRYFLEGA